MAFREVGDGTEVLGSVTRADLAHAFFVDLVFDLREGGGTFGSSGGALQKVSVLVFFDSNGGVFGFFLGKGGVLGLVGEVFLGLVLGWEVGF